MREVVVSGVGLVSCIGNDIDTVVTNLRNGNSGISRNEVYEQMGFRSCVSGSIDLNLREFIDRKKLRFMGNAAAYGFLATEMAIADAGLAPEKISSPKIGLIAGSGGASSAEQVIAADIARNKGVKRIGPYAVPKVMGSTVLSLIHI